MLLSAPLQQMHGHIVEGQTLESERDAHTVCAAAAPVAPQLHAVTPCWMLPNGALPSGNLNSMRTLLPVFKKAVCGAPWAMVSKARRSCRHVTPRSGAALEMVPLPKIVPAPKRRVLQMCSSS